MMSAERERERDRDVEFGKLVEAVKTLQREAVQKRIEDQENHKSLVETLTELQGDVHRLRAAKSIAAWLVVVLIGIGSGIAEWVRVLTDHHK